MKIKRREVEIELTADEMISAWLEVEKWNKIEELENIMPEEMSAVEKRKKALEEYVTGHSDIETVHWEGDKIEELIHDIVVFADFHDPWDFDDVFLGTDDNNGYDTAAKVYCDDLASGGEGTIDWLQNIIDDDEEDADEAAELIKRIKEIV